MAKTVADLRSKLAQSEATLQAIRDGEVDALVVSERAGDKIYTLDGADQVYRVLIETMSEGAAALDRTGTILFGNRRLADMLGRSADQIIGAAFESFLGEKHRKLFSEQLTIDPRHGLSVDVVLVASDRSTRPVHLSMALLDFGDVAGICLIATDMSERVTYERELAERAQELARSNAELERFAYVASHDLQEPLRMVASFTQLLAKRYKGRLDVQADEFIGFVVDGVTRMQSLITDLLDYSQVGRKQRPLEPIDLDDALSQALANLQATVAESGVVIEYGPLPEVWGDSAQLSRLFQNLVGNAIKFRSNEAPRVEISARETGGFCVIAVRDNGIGVDPRHFDRIFVLFQRLHDRSRYSGHGNRAGCVQEDRRTPRWKDLA